MANEVNTAEKAKEKGKDSVKEFTKEQILASEKYQNRKDIAEALLDEKKLYTTETVDKMIETFMKGEVK